MIIPRISINKSLTISKSPFELCPLELIEKHPQLKSNPRIILTVIAIIKIINNEESTIADFFIKIPVIKKVPKTNSIKGRIIATGLIKNSGRSL